MSPPVQIPADRAGIAEELDDTRILHELGARLVTEETLAAIYEEILAAAIKLMRADAGLVQLFEPATEELTLLSVRGLPEAFGTRFRRVNGASCTSCGKALQSQRRAFVDFNRDADDDAGSLKLIADAGFVSAQSTPLVGRSGTLIGMLTTHWRHPRHPGERELRFLDLLARQAADLIERAQAEAQRAEDRRRQEFLLTLGDALRPLADAAEVQMTASRLLGEHLGANRVGYAEAQADGETIVVPPHYTQGVPGIEGRYRCHDYGSGLPADFHAGRTVVKHDVANDPSLTAAERAAHVALQLGAAINKPLLKDGKLMAVLFVHFREAHRFTESEIVLLEEVAERTWAAVGHARAEEALRKSRSQLQAMFDAAPLGLFLVDSSLRILAVNPVALPSFGPGGDPVGSLLADRVPDFWENFAAETLAGHFRHTLDTGERHFVPVSRRGADRIHEWHIHRVPLSDGTHGAVCYFREISMEVQATEKVVASEAKYRTLFDSIDEGFCIVELLFNAAGTAYDYVFLEVNPAFGRHTGLADVEGKSMIELAPDQDPHWFQIYGRVAITGESIRFVEYSRPLERWFDVYAFRIGDARSRQVGVLFTNITERKDTEERLRRAAEFDAFRVALSDALRPLQSSERIQAEAARMLGERLGASRALYVEVETGSDSDYYVIREGYQTSGVSRLTGRFRTNDFGRTLFDEMQAGHTLVVHDVAAETRLSTPEKQAHHALDIHAYVAVPVRKGGRQVALVAVHQARPREWTDDEIALVEETSERTWEAAERARSEQARQQSEQRLRIALESAEMAAWDWNVVSDTVRWNDRHFLILGLEPDGQDKSTDYFCQFVHPEDKPALEASLFAAVNDAAAFHREFRIIRADNGEVRWMCGFGQTVESRAGKATRMTGVMYDATQPKVHAEELQRARDELEGRVAERTRELEKALVRLQDEIASREKIEQERRDLLERLVHTQEAERSRVARELHDNLGQHMVAVLLRLDTFQRQLAQTGNTLDYKFADLRAVIDGLIKATHRQSWELRPAELDELGLEVAVENLLQLWSEKIGIDAAFHPIAGEGSPAPEVTIAFYRVAQEALTNVARHSGARQVDVRLLTGKKPTLTIRDNGCGFDPAATRRRLGLLGMQERLDIIGGSLAIDSTPGRGTTIRASLP